MCKYKSQPLTFNKQVKTVVTQVRGGGPRAADRGRPPTRLHLTPPPPLPVSWQLSPSRRQRRPSPHSTPQKKKKKKIVAWAAHAHHRTAAAAGQAERHAAAQQMQDGPCRLGRVRRGGRHWHGGVPPTSLSLKTAMSMASAAVAASPSTSAVKRETPPSPDQPRRGGGEPNRQPRARRGSGRGPALDGFRLSTTSVASETPESTVVTTVEAVAVVTTVPSATRSAPVVLDGSGRHRGRRGRSCHPPRMRLPPTCDQTAFLLPISPPHPHPPASRQQPTRPPQNPPHPPP